jgi:hypothetical protein
VSKGLNSGLLSHISPSKGWSEFVKTKTYTHNLAAPPHPHQIGSYSRFVLDGFFKQLILIDIFLLMRIGGRSEKLAAAPSARFPVAVFNRVIHRIGGAPQKRK